MSSLFTRRLEQLVDATDGGLVPVRNASDARWSRDSSGRTWVRKHPWHITDETLVAEAVSHLLGQSLGVRQPAAAVLKDEDGWSWMSETVPGVSEHWSPELRDVIANPEEVAHMLALDAITANWDRHPGNLLLVPDEDGRFIVWAIDSGNALIGVRQDFVALGLAPPAVDKHVRGLPIGPLRAAALEAAVVASHLSDRLLTEFVEEGYWLGGDDDCADVTAAFVERCRQAPTIVNAHLDALVPTLSCFSGVSEAPGAPTARDGPLGYVQYPSRTAASRWAHLEPRQPPRNFGVPVPESLQ